MRQLEPGDTILSCHNCARIQGLDVVDSLLLMCKVRALLSTYGRHASTVLKITRLAPAWQRNIYIIDGYCMVVNKSTGKEEMLDVQQALADKLFVQTVPSIAENMGGGSPPPVCSVLLCSDHVAVFVFRRARRWATATHAR